MSIRKFAAQLACLLGSVGAAGAGAAFALVHGLDTGDRDRVALVDEVPGQGLGRWGVVGPRITVADESGRGSRSTR